MTDPSLALRLVTESQTVAGLAPIVAPSLARSPAVSVQGAGGQGHGHWRLIC